jgi:hypothetical protein
VTYPTKTNSPSNDGLFVFPVTSELHGQGVTNAVEGVVDLLTERGHDSNYNNSDERENDRVLNETLTFFFGSE